MIKKIMSSILSLLPSDLRKRLILELGRTLAGDPLRETVEIMVRDRVQQLQPAEALRFLFRLDAVFYGLQGHQAVRYDQGVHTKYRHTRYHDFFVARVHPGQKAIDIGCGDGFMAFRLAEKGVSVVGMDISRDNIDKAKLKYVHPNLTFRQGNALQEFVAATFDVVVLSNVLEHLQGRVDFLRAVVSRYQPLLLLIRVPLFERDWRVPLKQELGVEWRLDRTHEIEYTQETFAEEVQAAGLVIRHLEVRWGELWVALVRGGD
ncbi:MAG: class I SAM-dependent methyltransferase [Magnetococcales bacterium]|nr:class I SAM-dependent methyltransferase [Magnetococcales bacterium]